MSVLIGVLTNIQFPSYCEVGFHVSKVLGCYCCRNVLSVRMPVWDSSQAIPFLDANVETYVYKAFVCVG